MYACIEGNIGLGKDKLIDDLETAYHRAYEENEKKREMNDTVTQLPKIKFVRLPSFLQEYIMTTTSLSENIREHIKDTSFLADKILDYLSLLVRTLDEAFQDKSVHAIISDNSLITLRNHVLTLFDLGYFSPISVAGILSNISKHPVYTNPAYIIFMDLDFDPKLPDTRNARYNFTYPSPLYFEMFERYLYKFMFRWMSTEGNAMIRTEPNRTGDVIPENQIEVVLHQICGIVYTKAQSSI